MPFSGVRSNRLVRVAKIISITAEVARNQARPGRVNDVSIAIVAGACYGIVEIRENPDKFHFSS